MSLVIDGKGWSLSALMREHKYRELWWHDLVTLEAQLEDASKKAARPIRRHHFVTHAMHVRKYIGIAYAAIAIEEKINAS